MSDISLVDLERCIEIQRKAVENARYWKRDREERILNDLIEEKKKLFDDTKECPEHSRPAPPRRSGSGQAKRVG